MYAYSILPNTYQKRGLMPTAGSLLYHTQRELSNQITPPWSLTQYSETPSKEGLNTQRAAEEEEDREAEESATVPQRT